MRGGRSLRGDAISEAVCGAVDGDGLHAPQSWVLLARFRDGDECADVLRVLLPAGEAAWVVGQRHPPVARRPPHADPPGPSARQGCDGS